MDKRITDQLLRTDGREENIVKEESYSQLDKR
jgi:hypothetical protein